MEYTIGEAAAKLGITTSTLRYYDKEGLIPFVERSGGGIRIFKAEDFEWLRLIECLKATNMPIRDIKRFIDCSMKGDATLKERRDMFYERKRMVEAQMEALRETLDTINYKCWFYETAVEAGTADVPRTMQPEQLPENIRRLKEKISLFKK